MLRKEDWMYIKAQVEKGVYQKDIAQEVGVSAKMSASISLVL